MLSVKIVMKSINDIDIKVQLCKTSFEWEILAEKYSRLRDELEAEFKDSEMPKEIFDALERVRGALVQKKGEMPPQDLLNFFK